MLLVTSKAHAQGLLFELSNTDGGDPPLTTLKRFRPFRGSIVQVDLHDNRISYHDQDGNKYAFSFDGVDFTKMNLVDGDATDNSDLFDKFINLI